MHGQKKLTRRCPNIRTFLLCLASFPAYAANPYEQAIESALATHPSVLASMAGIDEARSNVKLAYQGMHPKIRVEGEVGRARTNQKSAARTSTTTSDPRNSGQTVGSSTSTSTVEQSIRPKTRKAVIEQPLYKGGQISAGIEAAQHKLQIARLRLQATRMNLRQQVTLAYVGVVVAEARYKLYQKIEHVLQQHVDAALLIQKIGSGSTIDVAQAESRLSGAKADRLDALTQLNLAKAQFEEFVGYAPEHHEFPDINLLLPHSKDEAIRQAERGNPDLLTLRCEESIAGAQITSARGELLPSLTLRGESAQSDNQFFKNVKTISSGVYANLSIPLYNSGGSMSRLSAARAQKKQKELAVADKLRSLRAETSVTFDKLFMQQAKVKARDTEYKAADLALQGIRIEQKTGGKSMLNLLDAEQEALNAHLALITAKADQINAKFALLKLLGDEGS